MGGGFSGGVRLDELTADAVEFDPSTTDLVATNVQAAIEEVVSNTSASASPGFNFGRASNVNNGTWLLVPGGPPSNKAGITVLLTDGLITGAYVACENANTFTLTFYQHEGDSINLTAIGSINVVASRSYTITGLDIPVEKDKQLAIQLTAGSAKNVSVGLQLKGSV